MKLFVMRHGLAEDAGASGGDAYRTLTGKGRRRVRAVARRLVDRVEIPDLILTSPLVRAVQTAEIVSAVADPVEPVRVREQLSPGGDLISLVSEYLQDSFDAVMIVGHEPGLSALMVDLVGPKIWDKPFAKTMVASLRLVPKGAVKLRFVLDPKTQEVRAGP